MGKDKERKIQNGGKGRKKQGRKGRKGVEERRGRRAKGWGRAGKKRTGKRNGWKTKRGRGVKERRGNEKHCKTAENRDFYPILTLGAPVPSPQPRSGPNLARMCRPMVYSSMPDFIVIGVYYYITTHNHANMTDVGNFGAPVLTTLNRSVPNFAH